MAAAKPEVYLFMFISGVSPTSGDVDRSCVGFLDRENVGAAVGILLLGGVEFNNVSVGSLFATPVHCEGDCNSVH